MSAAYEMFLERQEAEDELSSRKPARRTKRYRVICANCPQPTVDGAYYCPRCIETRRRSKSLRQAKAMGAMSGPKSSSASKEGRGQR